MKKITICLLGIFMLLTFCGCSNVKEESKIYTETKGNLQITYTYGYSNKSIISKNVYNVDTGITIEYSYFYENRGWGEQLIGISVITIDKNGQIIDKYDT